MASRSLPCSWVVTARAKWPWHTCGQRPVSNTSLCRGRMMQVSWPATLMPSTSNAPCQSEGRLPPGTQPDAFGRDHCHASQDYKALAASELSCNVKGLCLSCACFCIKASPKADNYSQSDSAPGAAGPSCAMLVHARWQACRPLGYKRLGQEDSQI